MASGAASIVVDAGHSPMAFLLYFSKITVTIDGVPESGPWGSRSREVPAGAHTVGVSFRYFGRDCGKAAINVDVPPQGTATLRYRAPFLVSSPGKLTQVA